MHPNGLKGSYIRICVVVDAINPGVKKFLEFLLSILKFFDPLNKILIGSAIDIIMGKGISNASCNAVLYPFCMEGTKSGVYHIAN